MADRDDIIRQISGLLAKAEATEFDAEREAFLAGAARLMAKHQIDEAAIDAAREDEVGWDTFVYSADDRFLDGKAILLALALMIAGGGTQGGVVHPESLDDIEGFDESADRHWATIVGYPVERAIARLAYTSLVTLALTEVARHNLTNEAVGNSFLIGFAHALRDKIVRAEGPVLARWKDDVHAVVEAADGRRVLVPWERFADPADPEFNDMPERREPPAPRGPKSTEQALRKLSDGMTNWLGIGKVGAIQIADDVPTARTIHSQREGSIVVVNPAMVAHPEDGGTTLRFITHEAAHTLSPERTLPGFSHDIEEGGAELLSQMHWAETFQITDNDAIRVGGRWVGGPAAMWGHGSYHELTRNLLGRVLAENPAATQADVKARLIDLMRSDHYQRMDFTNATQGSALATGTQLAWLLGGNPDDFNKVIAEREARPEFNDLPARPLAARMLDRSATLAEEEQIGSDLSAVFTMPVTERVAAQADMDGWPGPTQLEPGGPLVHQWKIRGQFVDTTTDDEIGEFQYVFSADRETGETSVLLDSISLDDEWQGSGIGSRFTVAVENAMRAAGVDRINLHAASAAGETYDSGVYCVPLRARMLTQGGWKSWDEIDPSEDLAAQWEDGFLVWRSIESVHLFGERETITFGHKNGWDFTCTANHKILATLWGKPPQLVRLDELMPKFGKLGAKIVTAAPLRSDDQSGLTADQAALLGWLVTDGWVTIRNRRGYTELTAGISQSKELGRKEVSALLDRLGGWSGRWSHQGTHVPAPLVRSIFTALGVPLQPGAIKLYLADAVLKMGHDQIAAFVHAAELAEGASGSFATGKGRRRMYQNPGPCNDALRLAFVLAGNRVGRSLPHGVGPADQWSVSSPTVATERLAITGRTSEEVWCPKTVTGTWVCELDGIISITGNTWARAGFGWDLSSENGRVWFSQTAPHIASDLERLPDPPDTLDADTVAFVRGQAADAAKSLRSLTERVRRHYATAPEPGDVTPAAIANLGRSQGWPVGKLAMSPYTNRSAPPDADGNRHLDFLYSKPLRTVGEVNDLPDRPEVADQPSGDGDPIDALVDEPVVARIVDRFADAGYRVYPVGGAVRDALSGKAPNDIDLTTDATPDETARLLDPIGAVYPLGAEHGTIVVNVGGEDYEVTTHRTERYDPDSRQPITEFTSDLAADLARRDFTFNAMAVDPETREVIDPFGGQADLAAGVVRSVGDADARFSEDPLRVVRAVRFAAVNGWSIDPDTAAAARRQADRLAIVSTERFQIELDKILKSLRPGSLRDAHRLADDLGATDRLFGPLAAAFTNPTPDGFVPIDDVPAPHRMAALVAAAGVDPYSLVQSMKRGSAEMRNIGDVLTAARLIRGGQAPLALRRYPDDVIVAVEAITTFAAAQVAGFWVARDKLRAKLPVDGNDMMALGLKGRDIRDALERVEERFLATGGRLTRDEALAAAR